MLSVFLIHIASLEEMQLSSLEYPKSKKGYAEQG